MMEIVFDNNGSDLVFKVKSCERTGWNFTALLNWNTASIWSLLIDRGIMRAKTPNGYYQLDLGKTTVKEGPALHVWVTVPVVEIIDPFKTYEERRIEDYDR